MRSIKSALTERLKTPSIQFNRCPRNHAATAKIHHGQPACGQCGNRWSRLNQDKYLEIYARPVYLAVEIMTKFHPKE
jgi:hypothetical protein